MSEETSTPGEERAQDRVENPDDRAGRLAEITAELTARSQEQQHVGTPDAAEASEQDLSDDEASEQDPADDETPEQDPADDETPEQDPADDETPEQDPADDETPEQDPAEHEVTEEDAPGSDQARRPGSGQDEEQPQQDEDHVQVGEEEQVEVRRPSFGVVFQAPDLSDLPRRRSRRATSGVTTPTDQPQDEQDEQAQEDRHDAAAKDDRDGPVRGRREQARASGVGDDRGDRDETDRTGSDDDGSDDEGGRGGRRRRRGGKGRRGTRSGSEQGAGDDGGTEQTGPEPTDDSTDPEGPDAPEGSDGDDDTQGGSGRRRSRSRRGRRPAGASGGDTDRGAQDEGQGAARDEDQDDQGEDDGAAGTRRRRRRRRSGESGQAERTTQDEVSSVKGSTRLEAKRQRRREGREAGRRRTIITEAEFLARRESVDRVMVVRGLPDRTQIAVLEDGVPVEHYVSRSAQSTMAGNVYLGRVQNVLPSMEAAFVDIGKGRNAVLYAGEVNWDAAGLEGNQPKRIENALKSGESVLVQVTKDPIGHKGARLTSQISLPGRYLVYVPGNSMTGISRKLPDTERARLKKILKEVVPADAGVIVRTAAEGAAEAELRADVERLTATWERIQAKAKGANAPALLHGEPDMTVRVIRDVFTEDFSKLVVSGEEAWAEVKRYIDEVAPDLADRVERHTGSTDIFTAHRVDEAIAKAMDRKVWLPSGGSLVIDRTEAMTVVDVNTGKFTGSGGNLEETVTKNNIEAAEEIVRQLRLRDIGGIIVIDFIDMVLEANRDLVVRRLLECLGRDRTKHQVAEVTSLGLVQMTRKRVGSGLIEVFSDTCVHCAGRGVVVHTEPVATRGGAQDEPAGGAGGRRGRGKGRSGPTGGNGSNGGSSEARNVLPVPNPNGPTPAQIAAAAHAAALHAGAPAPAADAAARAVAEEAAEDAPAAAHAPAATVSEDAGGTAAPSETQTAGGVPDAAPAATTGTATTGTATTGTAEEPEPVTQPRRRRPRGRVVAPAGPPTGADAAGEPIDD
ncbi:Rne/Rng family ribonuclease [Ornithinimicrobium sp. W1665]|uniref:Rne/Rng family ribonuclease n=1 Tax=Ornithinimicrobium sp. W1665 TaxID=3416666 RepID=UPI003CF75CF0